MQRIGRLSSSLAESEEVEEVAPDPERDAGGMRLLDRRRQLDQDHDYGLDGSTRADDGGTEIHTNTLARECRSCQTLATAAPANHIHRRNVPNSGKNIIQLPGG